MIASSDRSAARSVDWLSYLGMVAFVVTIIVAVEGAFVWSIAGYLHLPAPAFALLALLTAPPVLYSIWTVIRLGWEAEHEPFGEGEGSVDRPVGHG